MGAVAMLAVLVAGVVVVMVTVVSVVVVAVGVGVVAVVVVVVAAAVVVVVVSAVGVVVELVAVVWGVVLSLCCVEWAVSGCRVAWWRSLHKGEGGPVQPLAWRCSFLPAVPLAVPWCRMTGHLGEQWLGWGLQSPSPHFLPYVSSWCAHH